MKRVYWSERAQADFDSALAFIAEDNLQNAELVRGRIYNTLELLESFSLGVPAPKGTYKLFIPKTSYFVIFRRSEEGDVTLISFLHTSRDWGSIDWDKII